MKVPKCMLCSKFSDDDENSKLICEAFPDGIPHDVMWGEFDEECSNGIKFEEE